MLDDQHRVPSLHQQLEHVDEPPHIVGVQTGGGFVQNIDGLAGGALGQLRSQLHPLCLTAGEGGGGLPQLHIAQPHIRQRGQSLGDLGDGLEKLRRFLYGHVQHFPNILALVLDL